MTLDLVVLGAVCFAAAFGWWKGFSRQVATALGGLAAWLFAGPVGKALGPAASARFGTTLTVGIVLATIGVFLAVYLVVQVVATVVIRRVLAGRDANNSSRDRGLGLLLGGVKMGALWFVVICAATFLESTVVFAGRRVAFTPKDSKVVQLARSWNVFEHWQFSNVTDLVKVAKLMKNPANAERLKSDADLESLMRDNRFRSAVSAEGMKKALETGDVHALLGNKSVIELIQDPVLSERLARLSERLVQ